MAACGLLRRTAWAALIIWAATAPIAHLLRASCPADSRCIPWQMPNTKPAVPTDEAFTRHQLYDQNPARWHRQGYWTLEDLDVPPLEASARPTATYVINPRLSRLKRALARETLAPAPKPPTHKFDF